MRYQNKRKPGYKKTSSVDRKEIVIKKILAKINKRPVKQSVIPLKVINHKPIKKITVNTPVYYGQYKSTNKDILQFMKLHTEGKFRFGPIALRILYDGWTRGKLMTYMQFARKWLREYDKTDKPIKEW